MKGREARTRIVLEGVEKYLGDIRAIRKESERAQKAVAQLNEALKELAELRKQVLP